MTTDRTAKALADKSQGMRYTSKYGVVGAAILGMHVVVDGVNEKGLYVGGYYFQAKCPCCAGHRHNQSPISASAMLEYTFNTERRTNFKPDSTTA